MAWAGMEAGALCSAGADAHELRIQLAGARDGGMLRLRGGKEKRGREAESKKDGGFNFHAAFGTTSRDDGAGAVQEKPGAAGGDKKSAPTIDSGDAKAMLYQLTTQLFSPPFTLKPLESLPLRQCQADLPFSAAA